MFTCHQCVTCKFCVGTKDISKADETSSLGKCNLYVITATLQPKMLPTATSEKNSFVNKYYDRKTIFLYHVFAIFCRSVTKRLHPLPVLFFSYSHLPGFPYFLDAVIEPAYHPRTFPSISDHLPLSDKTPG